MLDVLPLDFSALQVLSFIIDTKISIKQRYNHTIIREYFIYFSSFLVFLFPDLNTKMKYTLSLQ